MAINWQSESKVFGVRASACLEIVVFFVFMSLLSVVLGANINYFSVNPHPFWIIVILISTQYGTIEGFVAALISTVILLLGPLPIRNILQDKFEYFYVLTKTPLLWFVSAIILGELRMKHIRERDYLREIATQAEAKEKKIAESYNSLKTIKERLELHVASEMQTALMAISGFNQLKDSGIEGIIIGTCNLTKTLIAPEAFSVFLLKEGVLKRVAQEEDAHLENYSDTFTPDSPLYEEIVNKKRVVSIHSSDFKILGKEGVLAVPILDHDKNEVLGMIKVERIPFIRLRTSTIESLRILGEWAGTAYASCLAQSSSPIEEML